MPWSSAGATTFDTHHGQKLVVAAVDQAVEHVGFELFRGLAQLRAVLRDLDDEQPLSLEIV